MHILPEPVKTLSAAADSRTNSTSRLVFTAFAALAIAGYAGAAAGNSPFGLDLPANPVADHVTLSEGIEPGQTKSLVNLDGAGCIRHIWVVVGRPGGARTLTNRKIALRIYFDGAKNPNVEAPVGDFFGVMHGLDYYNVDTQFISVQSENGYNCYFEMPFAKGARIEFENGPEKQTIIMQVDWHRYPGQQMTEQRRFCAQWRREMPAQRYGDNYMLFDADGPGDLIGFFYGVRLYDETDRWSHGGAENIYIDGMGDYPSFIRGLGGEDAFGTSFGGVLHSTESHRNAGMPYYYTADVGEARGAQRVVGYRFYVADPIPFRESIRFQFGSMANDICSTVYWYQRGAPRRFVRLPDWPHMLAGTELPKGSIDLPLPDQGSWGLGPVQENRAGEAIKNAMKGGQPERPFNPGDWVEKETYHGFVDFGRIHRPKTRGAGTFFAGKAAEAISFIEATEDMTAHVRLAWDDQLVLRVNDDPPFDFGTNGSFRDRTVDVPFKKGRNSIHVLLSNEAGTNHGGWVFAFRAASPSGAFLIPHFSADGAAAR